MFRTNCLDCLDRTNVTQTKIALRILENILDRIKQQNKVRCMQESNEYGLGGNDTDAYVFDILKNMWAENGDMMSK